MQPTINLMRAIGVEFARRMLRPLVIVGAWVAFTLVILGGWLAMQNAWWWFLEAVFIIGSLLFLLIILVVRILLHKVAPPLSSPQKQAVSNFVDRLQRVAENLQTPHIIIMYYVIRDTIRPTDSSFLATISKDSTTLAPDFIRLQKLFSR